MKTLLTGTVASAALLTSAASANVVTVSENEFLDMGFEELLSVELTSGSRRAQSIEDSAASVFVISHDDIRRSPARNVPELLRMVPGVQVSRVDHINYRVSIRGGNQSKANKLLVMIDGRSIYTPTFGGVYWDQHDLLLEDVERIEVVRGPGGTVWGANATNGVINIITKSAQDTQGLYANVEYGDEDRPTAGLRVGTKLRGGGAARLTAQYIERPSISNVDELRFVSSLTGSVPVRGPNGYETAKVSARFDQPLGELTTLMISAAVQRAEFGSTYSENAGFLQAHVLGRVDRQVGNGHVMVQVFADHSDRQGAGIGALTNVFDIDAAHDFSFWNRHQFVWGAGFRFQNDRFTPVAQDERESDWRASFFAQDEISFRDDTLRLTLGTKLEYNSVTGFEYQPSLRGLWRIGERRTLWTALSRNVRTPSRVDRSIQLPPESALLPNGQPSLVTTLGSEDVDSEIAYTAEIGYRSRFSSFLSLEGSVFATHYRDLIVETNDPLRQPPNTPLIVNTLTNRGEANALGVELAANFNPIERLRMQLAYSYVDLDVDAEDPPITSLRSANSILFTEEGTAGHLVSLRTSLDVLDTVTASAWTRYTSEQFGTELGDQFDVDLRLTYEPQPYFRASLIGENLLNDDEDFEAEEYLPTTTELSPIDRRLTAKLELDF